MSFVLTVLAVCSFIFSSVTFVVWLSRTDVMLLDLKLTIALVLAAIVAEWAASELDKNQEP